MLIKISTLILIIKETFLQCVHKTLAACTENGGCRMQNCLLVSHTSFPAASGKQTATL
jgi:hypothetical protein